MQGLTTKHPDRESMMHRFVFPVVVVGSGGGGGGGGGGAKSNHSVRLALSCLETRFWEMTMPESYPKTCFFNMM